MHLVDAEEWRRPDAVRYPRAAHFGPEFLVAHRVRRAQPDVAEPSDPGVARREIAPAAVQRPQDKFDRVTARIAESDEILDVALLAFGFGAAARRELQPIQRSSCRIQLVLARHLERDRVLRGIAFVIDKRVVAAVAAEV